MSWKHNPHLFTNGKFKCKVRDFESTYSIEEYTSKSDEYGLRRDEIITFRTYVSECILIARPISDMADEEVMSIAKKVHGTPETLRDIWEYKVAVEPDNLSFGVVKHLLDHGVYPGKQRNTEDLELRGKND